MGDVIKPIETQYSTNPNSREYVLFPEEYFAGANCAVYFGHKPITDISGLAFQLQEQMKPLFSYASRTFDEMAIGNRIVTGTFRIAFREAALIKEILREIENYDMESGSASLIGTDGENIPGWVGRSGYTPEALLGMAMVDPTPAEEEPGTPKIYIFGVRIFLPPDFGILNAALEGKIVPWIPVRFILDSLGYNVLYDEGTKTWVFMNRDKSEKLELKNSNSEVWVNGKKTSVPCKIVMNRSYCPARMFFESLGYKFTEEGLNWKITT